MRVLLVLCFLYVGAGFDGCLVLIYDVVAVDVLTAAYIFFCWFM